MNINNQQNIDPSEISKFNELSTHWWDIHGELRTLHQINPLRLAWINQYTPLKDKTVIDIGCGGGILTEGMAKLGAAVTGVDMSQAAIQVANLHQHESGVQVSYYLKTAEAMAKEHPAQFDVVTCMEMLEHVPDPASIIASCAKLVKPNGHLFFSTLNRNLKSYLFAIVGAEYVLKLIPRNTHDFAKFIKPSELSAWARQANLQVKQMTGITYHPFKKDFSLSDDLSVNYLMHFVHSGD